MPSAMRSRRRRGALQCEPAAAKLFNSIRWQASSGAVAGSGWATARLAIAVSGSPWSFPPAVSVTRAIPSARTLMSARPTSSWFGTSQSATARADCDRRTGGSAAANRGLAAPTRDAQSSSATVAQLSPDPDDRSHRAGCDHARQGRHVYRHVDGLAESSQLRIGRVVGFDAVSRHEGNGTPVRFTRVRPPVSSSATWGCAGYRPASGKLARKTNGAASSRMTARWPISAHDPGRGLCGPNPGSRRRRCGACGAGR
jgi:hypothetical protein